MIYLYRGLYIVGVFTGLKVLSFVVEASVAELAAYTALVILADNLSILRLQRVIKEEQDKAEKNSNEQS